MSWLSAEDVLQRAISFAADGLLNPAVALCEVARHYCGDAHLDKDRAKHPKCEHAEAYGVAFRAAMEAAGGSLCQWYESGGRRSRSDVTRLFQDALFNVQVGA